MVSGVMKERGINREKSAVLEAPKQVLNSNDLPNPNPLDASEEVLFIELSK